MQHQGLNPAPWPGGEAAGARHAPDRNVTSRKSAETAPDLLSRRVEVTGAVRTGGSGVLPPSLFRVRCPRSGIDPHEEHVVVRASPDGGLRIELIPEARELVGIAVPDRRPPEPGGP